jgi:hypothetical protein
MCRHLYPGTNLPFLILVVKMFEPTAKLLELNKKSGLNIFHEDFAKYLDDCDPLKEFRNEYYIPKNSDIPFGK